jgi:PPOX class probable F420-dependent enzyme
MQSIPAEFQDLFKDETKAYLYLATLMPDGSPQLTVVWFDTDGENILINTAEGRVKDRNMKARPKVALVIQDPTNPLRFVQIRGEVIGHTTEGGDAHINKLSLKYDGEPWTLVPGQTRVIFKIKPTRVSAH